MASGRPAWKGVKLIRHVLEELHLAKFVSEWTVEPLLGWFGVEPGKLIGVWTGAAVSVCAGALGISSAWMVAIFLTVTIVGLVAAKRWLAWSNAQKSRTLLAERKLLRTIDSDRRGVASVTFSPDGERIAAGSDVVYSPQRFHSEEDAYLEIRDAKLGRIIGERVSFFGQPIRAISYSSDGRLLTAQGQLLDGSRGREFKAVPMGELAIFARDGRIAIFGQQRGDTDGRLKLKVCDVRFREYLKYLRKGSDTDTDWASSVDLDNSVTSREGYLGKVSAMAFSPDGTWVASSNDETIQLWDSASAQLIRTLRAHPERVKSLTFTPDGKQILSLGAEGSLKRWNVETGELLQTIKPTWARMRVFALFASVVFAIACLVWMISRDAMYFAAINIVGDLVCLSLISSQSQDRKPGKQVIHFLGRSLPLAFSLSPDGGVIAAGMVNGTLELWDVATGRLRLVLPGHSKPVLSVAYSSDGKQIVTGGADGSIKVWRAHLERDWLILSAKAPDHN